MRDSRVMVARSGLVVILACLGAAAVAQTPTPAPMRAPEEQVMKPPASASAPSEALKREVPEQELPAETEARGVAVAGPPPDHSRPSANAGSLKSLEAVSLRDGEARVRLDGVERTLRAGDKIAGDVVRRIESHRMILARSEGDDREGIVIVTFDGKGRARVLVFTTVDSSPMDAPSVR